MLEQIYTDDTSSSGDIIDQNSTDWVEYSRKFSGLSMQSSNDISLSTLHP